MVSDGFHRGKYTAILVWGLSGFLAVKLIVRLAYSAPTVRFIGVKLADKSPSGKYPVRVRPVPPLARSSPDEVFKVIAKGENIGVVE